VISKHHSDSYSIFLIDLIREHFLLVLLMILQTTAVTNVRINGVVSIVRPYPINEYRNWLQCLSYCVTRKLSKIRMTGTLKLYEGDKRESLCSIGRRLTPLRLFTHYMPRPCRSPAMPCRVNSHMPWRAPTILRQCRVLRDSPHGSRKYPNC
jgi:hypothetical protein